MSPKVEHVQLPSTCIRSTCRQCGLGFMLCQQTYTVIIVHGCRRAAAVQRRSEWLNGNVMTRHVPGRPTVQRTRSAAMSHWLHHRLQSNDQSTYVSYNQGCDLGLYSVSVSSRGLESWVLNVSTPKVSWDLLNVLGDVSANHFFLLILLNWIK